MNYTIPRTTGELQQTHQDTSARSHYTIPRTTGELQLIFPLCVSNQHYTIPRTTGELQQWRLPSSWCFYYTIPRTTGELQLVCWWFFDILNYTIPRTTGELQLNRNKINNIIKLYHTKNHRGTTTTRSVICSMVTLYHMYLEILHHTQKSQHSKKSSHKKYIFLTFPSNPIKLKLSSSKPQVSLCIRLIYLRTIK